MKKQCIEDKMEEQIDLLIQFQYYLTMKKLITDYDWEFEKEAKKFIKYMRKLDKLAKSKK